MGEFSNNQRLHGYKAWPRPPTHPPPSIPLHPPTCPRVQIFNDVYAVLLGLLPWRGANMLVFPIDVEGHGAGDREAAWAGRGDGLGALLRCGGSGWSFREEGVVREPRGEGGALGGGVPEEGGL